MTTTITKKDLKNLLLEALQKKPLAPAVEAPVNIKSLVYKKQALDAALSTLSAAEITRLRTAIEMAGTNLRDASKRKATTLAQSKLTPKILASQIGTLWDKARLGQLVESTPLGQAVEELLVKWFGNETYDKFLYAVEAVTSTDPEDDARKLGMSEKAYYNKSAAFIEKLIARLQKM